ncbi:MAG TPA: LysM peptidoglycan-binding domain-containing protein [Planctomycetota bacterium]|nr:LysM peptidoglycan-binding domain-containing protein [Planctomycetota bacterium]
MEKGDTLSSIASKLGVSLSALESANPKIKNANLIYPGQTINVP